MSDAPDPQTRLRLRLVFGAQGMMGPGKADLLELIAETGSIAAAGRRMGMSYRRAWALVETLNAIFRAPLVERTRGGSTGGSAHLTEDGARILALYRALETRTRAAGADEIAAIEALLAPPSPGD